MKKMLVEKSAVQPHFVVFIIYLFIYLFIVYFHLHWSTKVKNARIQREKHIYLNGYVDNEHNHFDNHNQQQNPKYIYSSYC